MLSRTAEMFYWMGRYIERAEYTARMIDVHYDIHLESADRDVPAVDWEHYLESRQELEQFRTLYPATRTKHVLSFMVLNPDNPNSLVNLIRIARENGRSIQDQLTSEAWHQLNGFYLSMKNRTEAELFARPHTLLNHIKTECYTLAGVFRSTMLRDEGWMFYRLGKNIERPGHTVHLLMHPVFRATAPNPRALYEFQQCIAILKSASAYQSYRRVYGGNLVPKKIMQFLLFHDRFPRSVRFSTTLVRKLLSGLSGPADNAKRRATERLTGQLVADLEYISFEEVYQLGLSTFVADVMTSLESISDGIGQVFFRTHEMAEPPKPALHRRRAYFEKEDTQVTANKAVLSVHHRFAFRYETDKNAVGPLMRLAPPQHYGQQHTLDIRWHLEPPADVRHFTDAFGNWVWQFDPKNIEVMRGVLDLRIENQAFYNAKAELLLQGVLRRDSDCKVETEVFTRLTPLVDDSVAMGQWADALRARRIYGDELAQTLMAQVGAHMRHVPARPPVERTASEALALGVGSSRDLSHIMLSLCRKLGLPARYVSGYLPGENQMHAWLEILLPVGPSDAMAWVAYDPSHQCRCDERYITVAIGRDERDTAQTNGLYVDDAPGDLSAGVSVKIESQGPADLSDASDIGDPTEALTSETPQQQ